MFGGTIVVPTACVDHVPLLIEEGSVLAGFEGDRRHVRMEEAVLAADDVDSAGGNGSELQMGGDREHVVAEVEKVEAEAEGECVRVCIMWRRS